MIKLNKQERKSIIEKIAVFPFKEFKRPYPVLIAKELHWVLGKDNSFYCYCLRSNVSKALSWSSGSGFKNITKLEALLYML